MQVHFQRYGNDIQRMLLNEWSLLRLSSVKKPSSCPSVVTLLTSAITKTRQSLNLGMFVCRRWGWLTLTCDRGQTASSFEDKRCLSNSLTCPWQPTRAPLPTPFPPAHQPLFLNPEWWAGVRSRKVQVSRVLTWVTLSFRVSHSSSCPLSHVRTEATPTFQGHSEQSPLHRAPAHSSGQVHQPFPKQFNPVTILGDMKIRAKSKKRVRVSKVEEKTDTHA